jgi:hypothetical protein
MMDHRSCGMKAEQRFGQGQEEESIPSGTVTRNERMNRRIDEWSWNVNERKERGRESKVSKGQNVTHLHQLSSTVIKFHEWWCLVKTRNVIHPVELPWRSQSSFTLTRSKFVSSMSLSDREQKLWRIRTQETGFWSREMSCSSMGRKRGCVANALIVSEHPNQQPKSTLINQSTSMHQGRQCKKIIIT